MPAEIFRAGSPAGGVAQRTALGLRKPRRSDPGDMRGRKKPHGVKFTHVNWRLGVSAFGSWESPVLKMSTRHAGDEQPGWGRAADGAWPLCCEILANIFSPLTFDPGKCAPGAAI